MEPRKSVTLLQKVGTHWLLVTERNPNVENQRFIRELCAESPATLSSFWKDNWSVQIGFGEGDEWIVTGTKWKESSEAALQSCSVDMMDSVAPCAEKEWNRNRRIKTLMYSRYSWILLAENVQGEEVLGQQLVKTAHWPGDEIQQIWAQKKRIQSIYGGPQDWTIVAEQLRRPAPAQIVQAGPDPSNFDFNQHLSSGYKLIGATFQPTTMVYLFLWEATSPDDKSAQEVYFEASFPSTRLSKLGYYLEASRDLS